MTSLTDSKVTVGFVGAGNMATALVRGLKRQGLRPAQIWVTDIAEDKTAALTKELGISASQDLASMIPHVRVVVFAVKPAGIAPLAHAHAGALGDRLVLSVAAGVSLAKLEAALGPPSRVIRAMPNTPALVGHGATGLARGTHATDADLAIASDLFRAVGLVEVVDESMMDAVTALSGSGPAFIMMVIEALADGGVNSGLPRAVALRLAAQTVKGSAALLLETGKHPGELKDMVTSPGGTTIAGVAALEKAGLRGALLSAVKAATERSRELGEK